MTTYRELMRSFIATPGTIVEWIRWLSVGVARLLREITWKR